MTITTTSAYFSYQSSTATATFAGAGDGDFAAALEAANSTGTAEATEENAGKSGPNAVMDTADGPQTIDLEDYFAVKSEPDPNALSRAQLFAPTPGNIAALSKHASEKFSQLLSDHGIPYAPTQITYGTDGKMQMPADYPFADQLEHALESDPAMARELSTVQALSSQFSGMQQSLAFSKAYAAARSDAEAAAVVQRFSALFSDSRSYPDLPLAFSADGTLNTAGKVGV
jgi:hypothetical protein